MFQVYFDDSGTDTRSPMAIAACYISTKRGWDEFVQQWDSVRYSEDFDVFHMANFAHYHEKREENKPFCDWDFGKGSAFIRDWRLSSITTSGIFGSYNSQECGYSIIFSVMTTARRRRRTKEKSFTDSVTC